MEDPLKRMEDLLKRMEHPLSSWGLLILNKDITTNPLPIGLSPIGIMLEANSLSNLSQEYFGAGFHRSGEQLIHTH
jgi:hypothetical protein